jgi:hypothetical protein
MRLPVSIRAVAMMVSEPPSSMLRAAPKKRFGAAGRWRRHRRSAPCPTTDRGVVGAAQAGDRVQQDHHVALVLDQALGLLDDHLGHLDVTGRRFVEGRGDTSPFTVRCMSVTSSGRSSIKRTIR